ANLIISRAGAGSIFEIAYLAKPSILIPLPNSAQDHQLENAYEYSKFGATIVMEQQNMTPHLFLNNIAHILNDETIIRKMSADAEKFATPQAARKIAEEVFYFGEL
ncbi:MAG: undecaprenyldiphospho-muramoylpentapeptide beta-N-acetylglucosaminyltransferase, MurG, partial [Parcubacteria group bacterium GW2011_GWD2_38_12]